MKRAYEALIASEKTGESAFTLYFIADLPGWISAQDAFDTLYPHLKAIAVYEVD